MVDTPGFWSIFGELVILGLIQVGGLGVMTLATLLGLLTTRRLGLRARLWAQSETKSIGPGDVRRVISGVVRLTVLFEVATAVLLTGRLMTGYGEPLGRAAGATNRRLVEPSVPWSKARSSACPASTANDSDRA